jgi:MSHA type pilus biogenesis protein MshL
MSGVIVVTDRPSRLEIVERFIDRINESLRRQVIIEAKIVEVILNKGNEWGINWNYLQKNFLNTGIFGISQTLSEGANAFRIGFVDQTGNDTGEVILDALATQGNVNILSSPRLNVLNNQSALISVGQIIPYLDFQIGSTVSRGIGGDIPIIDSVPIIARTLEGVTLGITPQISADGVTTLHIVPIITEQTGNRTISLALDTSTSPPDDENGDDGSQNATKSVDIPVFSVREADTIVRVRDNETIIIGGLISENTKDNVRKVPILGDIPYLGALFTHQQRETIKSELVILLTTTVVTE